MFATLENTVTAIVCLITAIVIQRIYYKEKKTHLKAYEIKGIMWFGIAIFVWGLGALFNLILMSGFGWPETHKMLIYCGVIVSLLNSLFILLSLPSIEHEGKRNILIRMVERFSAREFAMLFGGVMSMLTFVFLAASYANDTLANTYIWLIDVPVSIVVAFALLNALNKAFSNRNMRFMYLPSFALFVLIVIAVTHRIIPQDDVSGFMELSSWILLGTATAISFKFLFILLFSILLYSWKFLSEKEYKQGQLEVALLQKKELEKDNVKYQIANESHLDTITRLKEALKVLEIAAKIELSDRQKEVLANLGICGGKKSYTEIAEEMHISVDGFQAHIHQIKKLLNISGADGKMQLMQYAKDNDLLKFSSIKKK